MYLVKEQVGSIKKLSVCFETQVKMHKYYYYYFEKLYLTPLKISVFKKKFRVLEQTFIIGLHVIIIIIVLYINNLINRED